MSIAMSENISIEDLVELNKHEKIIRDNIDSTVQTWLSLEIIRDKRLYRKDYGTFEEYCQKKWDFSRRHADKMISGAIAVKALPKDLRTIVLNSGGNPPHWLRYPPKIELRSSKKLKKQASQQRQQPSHRLLPQ